MPDRLASEELAGSCGRSIPVAPETKVIFKAEAAGYVAMLTFLCAYLLDVAGTGHLIKAVLNLTGAGVGAIYLHGKGAVPSMISNLLWAAITIVGLVVSRGA